MEIGVFVRYLRCFSQIENGQINKNTIELLEEAMTNIKSLTQQAHIIENSDRNDVDFLSELNEQQFGLQRYILCRTCDVSVKQIIAEFHSKAVNFIINRNNNSIGRNTKQTNKRKPHADLRFGIIFFCFDFAGPVSTE